VLERVREHIFAGTTIPYRPAKSGDEPEFGGRVGEYAYLFEGEDDLLHLIVTRNDGSPMAEEETTAAARFLLPDVPEAMVWLRPGTDAHHYYLGHDLLCSNG